MGLPCSLKPQYDVHGSFFPNVVITAMIGENFELEKPLITKTNL
jgi:hypothetical protein